MSGERGRAERRADGFRNITYISSPPLPPGVWYILSRRNSLVLTKPNQQEKNRNTSLYTEHNTKSKTKAVKEKEDDPSKRSFDKEKDIRGGIKIGHAQKKELLNKAADFGSRFAGGNYL